MITVREAVDSDVAAIREIFLSCYGQDYPYQQFYDPHLLTKMVYSDDTLILVAEENATGTVLGTASVILEVGAYSDLVGEFGRLAVRPEARHRGVGKLLMEERICRVREQLHLGLIEGRVAHPYTQKIACLHGFAVVGFEPLKMLIKRRESGALMVQHFGPALELRRNHPRVIPEVLPLAHLAMEHCCTPCDSIVDDDAQPYPGDRTYELLELSTEGYAPLLRIERGRVRHREVFGPARLHYGFFKLRARQSTYLLAREDGRVVGAIGFTHDPVEKVVRIFELISLDDAVPRFLLTEIERLCRVDWGVAYIDIDVSADAPRMQRTLLELGFLPVAYIPALAFHDVERLDVVKMARLLVPLDLDPFCLDPRTQAIADIVLRGFVRRQVLPRVAEAVRQVRLFRDLELEQIRRLAGLFGTRVFAPGSRLIERGREATDLFLILDGDVAVHLDADQECIGRIAPGECLGETGVLNHVPHSATAIATSRVETAYASQADLHELVRQRPDIGLTLFRNLASGLNQKLLRVSQERHTPESSA
jgi:GNAT superfamily N-acetyltransferase